ncbi:MAG: hypothetical protein IK020_09685 [Clostridiales bacterium]|nr:hypothetical protein [Clostridiales bacterium]
MSERVEKRDTELAQRSEELSSEQKRIHEKTDKLANLRGVSFLALALFLVLYLADGRKWWYLAGAGVALVVFVIFVIRHGRLRYEENRLDVLIGIHDQYIARTKHDFSAFSDDGTDLSPKEHPYSGDLDLFGARSLFSLISVAHTAYGRKQLRDWLLYASSEDQDIRDIRARQEAVKELSGRLSLVEELETSTKMNVKKRGSPTALLSYISSENTSPGKSLIVLRIVISVFLWVSLVTAFIIGGYAFFAPLVFLALQMAVMAWTYKSNAVVFELVEKFYPELSANANIFASLENVEVEAPYLQEIKKQIYGDKESDGERQAASNQLKTLYRICLLIQTRMQPLLYFLLNLVMPFDELCLSLLEKWRQASGSKIPSKLLAIGKWEALMSLSTLHTIYPDGCVPEIFDSDEPFFRAKEAGHPLIPEDKLVRNDFSLEKGCAMITGSNMSGKTTLLRTVGINLVLAYAGATCPCSVLELSIMNLGASMRIGDNLGEGVSTFYAELIKISRIVEMARKGRPLLFLIDEIFRGTNSKDRTDGAWTVLKQLHKPTIIGMMSTHDYELCKMNDGKEVDLVYYHFSEYFDNDGLHFDYKLKDGMSTETNAKYLMRMVGIFD